MLLCLPSIPKNGFIPWGAQMGPGWGCCPGAVSTASWGAEDAGALCTKQVLKHSFFFPQRRAQTCGDGEGLSLQDADAAESRDKRGAPCKPPNHHRVGQHSEVRNSAWREKSVLSCFQPMLNTKKITPCLGSLGQLRHNLLLQSVGMEWGLRSVWGFQCSSELSFTAHTCSPSCCSCCRLHLEGEQGAGRTLPAALRAAPHPTCSATLVLLTAVVP